MLTRCDHPARTELDALIADLASRQVPIAEVGLRPIPDADIAALATSVASQLASDDLSDDSIRRVVSAADGNPLFAVESARALAAGQTAVPPNLRTAVRVSVAALSDQGRVLARLLAAPLPRTHARWALQPKLPTSSIERLTARPMMAAFGWSCPGFSPGWVVTRRWRRGVRPWHCCLEIASLPPGPGGGGKCVRSRAIPKRRSPLT